MGDVLPIWIAVGLLTTLPYLIAALRTPDGYRFTGVLTAYDDTLTYLAWIRQGAEGRLLMCDRFTSEPHPCEFFLPLWAFLGMISRVTGAPVALSFHAGRLLSALSLLLVGRALARRYMKSRTRLRFTLWMYATASGLGWLVYAINNRLSLNGAGMIAGSADLNIPEATMLRSAFAQVHFTAGAALLCGAILLLFAALNDGKPWQAVIAGLLTSLLAVVHPYLIVVTFAVTAIACLCRPWLGAGGGDLYNRYMVVGGTLMGFLASASPGLFYLLYLDQHSQVLHEWKQSMTTPSPAPPQYALGFGLILVLAFAGSRQAWRARAVFGPLLILWVVTQSLLLYAPVSFQRRLIEGLQLPLAIIASIAVFRMSSRLRRKWHITAGQRSVLLIALIAVTSLTNAGFIAGQMAPGQNRTAAGDPRRYVPADLMAAFEWLRLNSEPDQVLMSSYTTGNLAPSITGLRVYLGHYDQTIRSHEKGREVAAFYKMELSDEAARQLVLQSGASYVIYGPYERETGSGFIARPWLKVIYSEGGVEIFKVESDE